jgi:hypothetical protein
MELSQILNPEQVRQLKEAGYEINRTEVVNQLISDRRALLLIFGKMKPVLAGFSGQTDIMAALPAILPIAQGLTSDEELKKAMEAAMEMV